MVSRVFVDFLDWHLNVIYIFQFAYLCISLYSFAYLCIPLQFNILEKERITASHEQPHRHTNVGLPSMKTAELQPQSMAKSVDFCELARSLFPLLHVSTNVCVCVCVYFSPTTVPGVGNLQCGMEVTLSLRPLSATNVRSLSAFLHLHVHVCQ